MSAAQPETREDLVGTAITSMGSEEARIINLHRNLERYIGIEPSEMRGGPR